MAARKNMLVAVAANEGKPITQHFGRAGLFHIYRFGDGRAELVETRRTTPCCQDFDHHEGALKGNADLIADCAWVVVARVGPGPERVLQARGIRIMVVYDYIEEALAHLGQLLQASLAADGEAGR